MIEYKIITALQPEEFIKQVNQAAKDGWIILVPMTTNSDCIVNQFDSRLITP